VDDLTRPAFRRRIRRYMEERRTEQAFAFFLFRQSDDVLLGGLTLSNIRRGVAQTCTLGYWMGEPHAGQGHMAGGVRTVIPFVFDVLRLRRIEAACLPGNQASIRLLERVGFIREGLARQYLCIDGRWQDHLLFAFLKGDRRG
jgi:ribosomal-protein-alanine N-acetyltransferase